MKFEGKTLQLIKHNCLAVNNEIKISWFGACYFGEVRKSDMNMVAATKTL